MDPTITDPIVDQVIAKYKQRSEVGIKKYGTTLASNKLSLAQWIMHVQEELMDATLYLEKLKEELPTRFSDIQLSDTSNTSKLSSYHGQSTDESWIQPWNHEEEFQTASNHTSVSSQDRYDPSQSNTRPIAR